MWLEGGLVKINIAIIHRVTIYLTLDRIKTMRCVEKNIIKDHIKAKWNDHGMYFDGIKDPL